MADILEKQYIAYGIIIHIRDAPDADTPDDFPNTAVTVEGAINIMDLKTSNRNLMSLEEEKREYVLNAIASYPTQQEAATALGTCPKVVSQWSRNKAQPRELAVRVVQLLDVLKAAGIEIPPPLSF